MKDKKTAKETTKKLDFKSLKISRKQFGKINFEGKKFERLSCS